jgi:hypothetical protein
VLKRRAKLAEPVDHPAERQSFLNRALRNSECLRAHGITNFPDPNPNTLAVHPGGGISIAISNSNVSGSEIHTEMESQLGQAAIKACTPRGAVFGGRQVG